MSFGAACDPKSTSLGAPMSTLRRNTFVQHVLMAGALLGVMTGVLIGLSESPVAGVAVTATLTLAGALIGSAAPSSRALFTRWRIFVLFVIPFSLALIPAMAGGLFWRSKQPSPGEQLIASFRGLGLTDKEIAEQLGKAAAAGGGAAVLFPTSSVLRSASGPTGGAAAGPGLLSDCANSMLRPPPGEALFSDPALIRDFEQRAGRFAEIAAWVRRQQVPANVQESSFRLALLSAARFGACGS